MLGFSAFDATVMIEKYIPSNRYNYLLFYAQDSNLR
jgi:hypothetical protein